MSIYRKLIESHEDEYYDIVLSDKDIELDGSFGVIENNKERYPELTKVYDIVDEGEKLKEIAAILGESELLFLTCTHGSDSLAFKIDSKSQVENNIRQYGEIYALNYIPVNALPNLWSSPGNEIDCAIENYVKSHFSESCIDLAKKHEELIATVKVKREQKKKKPFWKLW